VINLHDRTDRVESGPVRFTYKDGCEDWRGYFLRGDDALHLGMCLIEAAGLLTDTNLILASVLKGFGKDLLSVDEAKGD